MYAAFLQYIADVFPNRSLLADGSNLLEVRNVSPCRLLGAGCVARTTAERKDVVLYSGWNILHIELPWHALTTLAHWRVLPVD